MIFMRVNWGDHQKSPRRCVRCALEEIKNNDCARGREERGERRMGSEGGRDGRCLDFSTIGVWSNDLQGEVHDLDY